MKSKRSLTKRVGIAIAALCGVLVCAPTFSEELARPEVEEAMAKLPSRFLGIACQKEPMLPEGVMAACFENEKLVAGGSIMFSWPKTDYSGLVDELHRRNKGVVGFKIVSEEPFQLSGPVGSVGLKAVYENAFGRKDWWIGWKEGQLIVATIKDPPGGLPKDVHEMVLRDFFNSSTPSMATK